MAVAPATFDPGSITRPDAALLRYYLVVSVLPLVWFPPLMILISPLIFLPYYFKYRTLRYRFDDEGVSMSWGLVFRHETHLTYRRIQDIHVTRNLIHRWFGLARVEVQTASGSSSAEMAIEGVLEADALRDFLYSRMRGVRGEWGERETDPVAIHAPGATAEDETLALLHEIRDELRLLRTEKGRPS